MRQADFDLLLELYLDRDLHPAQHRELLDAVRSDPARRAEFLNAVAQSLRLASGLKVTDPALYERVAYILEKEKESGEETVNGVLAKLKRKPLPAPRARRFPAWKVRRTPMPAITWGLSPVSASVSKWMVPRSGTR